MIAGGGGKINQFHLLYYFPGYNYKYITPEGILLPVNGGHNPNRTTISLPKIVIFFLIIFHALCSLVKQNFTETAKR